MVQKVDWKTFDSQQKEKAAQQSGDRKELKFITMGKKGIGNTYTLRPLGDIVQFYEYMIQHEGRWRSAITPVENLNECPIKIKHGENPKEVYAVNVLDRADGQVKILKGPVSVFKEFYTFWKMRGKNPGGPNGGDFEIEVTGKKGKDYYRVDFVDQTPLEEDEIEMLSGNLYQLENIYKATPIEEIEEKLYPSSDGGGNSSGGNESSSESKERPVAAGASDDDDTIPF